MNVHGPGQRLTDDRGHYRLANLGPGEYYVGASAGVFTDQNASGGFAPSYFPGTTDAMTAKSVRVPVGQDVSNVSFALAPARMAQLSGTLVNDGRQGAGNVMLC